MKIAFVWDWDNPLLYLYGWKDGLAAALRYIAREHSVKIYTQIIGIDRETIVKHDYFDIYAYPDWQSMAAQVLKDGPEVALFWADMTRPAIDTIAEKIPSAVCFAGGDPQGEKSRWFKRVFVESKEYKDTLEFAGVKAIQAFGTNTELFDVKQQPKIFDAFFPATFADWKRHSLFAEAVKGLPALACGWFQPHEPWCHEVCEKAGVMVTPHIPSAQIVDFYNASKVVVITSAGYGGSQRAVIEALAMNIPVITMADNNKTSEYVIEAGHPEFVCSPDPVAIRKKILELSSVKIETRQWVLENYSEVVYARKLIEGLKEICNSSIGQGTTT